MSERVTQCNALMRVKILNESLLQFNVSRFLEICLILQA